MDSYSFFLRKALMPIYEMVKGKPLLHYLDEYEKHLTWPAEKLEAYQWERLQQLLKHCYETCEYYRTAWTAQGVRDIRDVTCRADFEALPILTKDIVNNHYKDLLSSSFNNNIRKSTGGSTGQPFRFELNVDSNTRREAVMWRGYGWLGAGLGTKSLYLWGADLGPPTILKSLKTDLYHRFYNRKMLNCFSLSSMNMLEHIKDINDYQPKAMVCYTNPLYELARFINEGGYAVFSPETILSAAEPLMDFQREEIEKAFNCAVHDTFGCREFMLIAAECSSHGRLHINNDHLVVETVNDSGNPVVGRSGDLVVTDLFNYGMPLIRYQNGDRATLSSDTCKCGNPLPLMERVNGRKLDIIKTSSGKKIPGELFPHIFKDFSGIKRFQVQQKSLSELIIKIVASEEYKAEDQQCIAAEINKYASGELLLIFDLVEDIPLTAAGKHRVTICDV
ncbi:MAG: hypothetical protein V7739_02735 [Motiliproteus sp.]